MSHNFMLFMFNIQIYLCLDGGCQYFKNNQRYKMFISDLNADLNFACCFFF